MKARVKATGEIVDIAYTYKTAGNNPISKCETLKGKRYNEEDLDFNIEDDNTPDYWTRLEHQYAGMAMQGILSNPESELDYIGDDTLPQALAGCAARLAHALVEKMKEERK